MWQGHRVEREPEFVQGTGRHLSVVEENREVGGEVRVLSLGVGKKLGVT